MPQDGMYVAKEQIWNRELYKDTLYKSEDISYPKDSFMFSENPQPDMPILSDFIYPNILPRTNSVDMDRILKDFAKITNSPNLSRFITLPYMEFDVYYDNDETQNYVCHNLTTMLVQNNLRDGLNNRSAKSDVFLFIPFELAGINTINDVVLINKLHVINNSNILIQNVATGVFRSPVAITRNPNHPRLDRMNCNIYNHEWFLIRLQMPTSNFLRK